MLLDVEKVGLKFKSCTCIFFTAFPWPWLHKNQWMKSILEFIFRIVDASSFLSLQGRTSYQSSGTFISREEDTVISPRHCSLSESTPPKQQRANAAEVWHYAISSSHQSLQHKQLSPSKTGPAIPVLSLSVIMSKLHKTFLPITSAKSLCQDDLRLFLAHESSLPSAVIF